MRREVYRQSGWALDAVGRLLDVRIIEAPGERIELALPTTRDILTMAVLANSPARVFSVDGTRVNFHGTDVLDASIEATPTGDTIRLSGTMPEGGGEALIVAPRGRRIVDDAARLAPFGDLWLAVVPLEAGKSTLELALEDVPPTHPDGGITGGQSEIEAGEALALSFGAGGPVTAMITRDDVPLYLGPAPVVDGRVTLAVPEQLEAGEIEIALSTEADGRLLRGHFRVSVTGSYQPDLPPWRLPYTGPFGEVAEVDVEARGLHVIGAATEHFDGRNGPQVGIAEPEALCFGGGIADAPVTRYGYGYGALELENARVLRLRITNTFFDAWTFNRGMPSYHPQYTSTFAGMFVDYHTDAGYIRRVALGLGIINPKREIGRPEWGAAAVPQEYIALADAINEGRETTVTIDLARWAPEGWDGRCWLTAGAENVYPSRRLYVEIVEAFDSPEGHSILEGQAVGDLFAIRDYTVVRAEQPPTIDGQLDDEAWRVANPAADFRLLGKVSGSEQATTAWAVWDDEHLYVAYRCPESEKQQPTLTSEKIWNRDTVDTALDPDGDREDFQQVMVDAAGRVEQFTKRPDGLTECWDVRTAVGEYEGGWSVELAIPWSEMGVEPASGMTMTGNFVRYRPYPPVDEMHTWSPMPGPAINDPERFAIFTLQ